MLPKTRLMTLAALFAAVIAVSAHIRIPAGPVPLTLQPAAVLTTGFCLGPSWGAAACLIYLAVGLAGLPVFAQGGGIAYVASPTFGYLVGFCLGAAVCGLLAGASRQSSVPRTYLLMALSLAGIYVPGALWLYIYSIHVADVTAPLQLVLTSGVLVPLPGDLVTLVPAAVLSVRLRKIIRRE